jgi:hypothetical protein
MKKRGHILVPVVMLMLAIQGCSGSDEPAEPAPGSIDIQQMCMQRYGSGAKSVGINGQVPTGWYCEKPGGDQAAVTVADLQQACDKQHPGTRLVNIGDPDHPQKTNSQWRCLPKG